MLTNRLVIFFFMLGSALFGFQCRTINSSASQKAMYMSIYIDQFRLTYFRKILVKSYNNSKAAHEIISLDHSGFTEPILTTEDDMLIDSLVTADNEKMTTDSISNIGRVAEGAEGKRQLGFILDRVRGKWLDSIAKKRYRIAKRLGLW